MTPEAKETARKVAQLLRDKGWTQGFHARDDKGKSVAYDSPEAVCLCLQGAMLRADGKHLSALCDEIERRTGNSITEWNDHPDRKKEEVIALLEEIAG